MKTKLRVRAADNGRSMEEEVRLMLRDAVGQEDAPAKGLGTAIHELFKPFGGVELVLPHREPMPLTADASHSAPASNRTAITTVDRASSRIRRFFSR